MISSPDNTHAARLLETVASASPLRRFRSADFQSAVSQRFQPAERSNNPCPCVCPAPAGWKPATQQVGNLRYGWNKLAAS